MYPNYSVEKLQSWGLLRHDLLRKMLPIRVELREFLFFIEFSPSL